MDKDCKLLYSLIKEYWPPWVLEDLYYHDDSRRAWISRPLGGSTEPPSIRFRVSGLYAVWCDILLVVTSFFPYRGICFLDPAMGLFFSDDVGRVLLGQSADLQYFEMADILILLIK